MKRVVGFRDSRMIGPRVKPRWVFSAFTVSLVASGGMGRVIFSLPLMTIQNAHDLSQAVERVRAGGHSVEEFMECLRRAWTQRYGKSLDESL